MRLYEIMQNNYPYPHGRYLANFFEDARGGGEIIAYIIIIIFNDSPLGVQNEKLIPLAVIY